MYYVIIRNIQLGGKKYTLPEKIFKLRQRPEKPKY